MAGELAPVFITPYPAAVIAGQSYLVFSVSTDVPANLSYALLPRGTTPAPSPAQLYSGEAVNAVSIGTVALAGNQAMELGVGQLSLFATSAYTMYMAAGRVVSAAGVLEQAFVTAGQET